MVFIGALGRRRRYVFWFALVCGTFPHNARNIGIERSRDPDPTKQAGYESRVKVVVAIGLAIIALTVILTAVAS